jgi:hypothetical protein
MFLRFKKKKIEGSSEQQLQFVQIRPRANIGPAMQGPFSRDLEISSSYLPNGHLLPRNELIPFSIDFQYPTNVVKGAPFSFLLGISSGSTLWNQNPPKVEVLTFQLDLHAVDNARSGAASRHHLKLYRIWNWRFLHMPLGSEPVDMGHRYSFKVTGDGIITSFRTTLLERMYTFLIDLTIVVGGKSFKVERHGTVCVEVQSSDIAPNNILPPKQDSIAGASYIQTSIRPDKATM